MDLVLYWPEIIHNTGSSKFPYHIGYLGAMIKNSGFNLRYVITDLSSISNSLERSDRLGSWFVEKDLRNILSAPVDVLLVSAWFFNLPYALELIKRIKLERPQLKIVMGGYPASTIPEVIFEICKDIDFFVIGEAEQSLIELLNLLEKDNASDGFDANKISILQYDNLPISIAFKDLEGNILRSQSLIHGKDSSVIINSQPCSREFVFPDYDGVLDSKNYDILGVEFSRGCSYNLCNFCTSQKYAKFNEMSIELVEKIISHISNNLKRNFIDIYDNHFFYDVERVKAISSILKKYNLKWNCYSRIDIPINILDIVVENNCDSIFFGIESLDKKSLANMSKTPNPDSYINNTIEVINRLIFLTSNHAGFNVNFSLIGCQVSDFKNMLSTKQFEFLSANSPHINEIIQGLPGNRKFEFDISSFKFDLQNNFFYSKYGDLFKEKMFLSKKNKL